MNLIKLGLKDLPISVKVQLGRQVVQAMDGNPHFLAPNPSLAAITSGIEATETAFNEAQAARLIAKTKTTIQDEQVAALDLLLTQVANYVENISNGDPIIIGSANLNLRKARTPIGVLPAPTGVQVAPSEFSGHADVSWAKVRGAKTYIIERAENIDAADWKVIGFSTKSYATLNSMVSGKQYWFRVCAIGAAGPSAWSNPVAIFAP